MSSLAWSLVLRPPPYVEGYQDLAKFVSEQSPDDSFILFSGYRDGTFVFNVRHEARAGIGVLRADKLLLRVAIERERGVNIVATSRSRLLEDMRRFRVRYVVAEDDFWTDLPPMVMLAELLRDDTLFDEVKVIRTEANYPHSDQVLRVFRYRGDLPPARDKVILEMKGIDRTFSQ